MPITFLVLPHLQCTKSGPWQVLVTFIEIILTRFMRRNAANSILAASHSAAEEGENSGSYLLRCTAYNQFMYVHVRVTNRWLSFKKSSKNL